NLKADEVPFLDLGSGFSAVLDVNGAVFQARQLDIAPNGLLRGNGNIVSDQVTVAGTLGPGDSIGAMTVHGDLSFEPGSQLNIEVDNQGNSDKLIVTGTTAINGGTVKTITRETITASRQYTIIQSNEITGPGFDAIDTQGTAFLNIGVRNISSTTNLQYGQNTVVLDVTIVPFTDPTVTDTLNRRELGEALQRAVADGGNEITTALQQIRSQSEVGQSYDQLSGQSRASLTTITSEGASRLTGAVSGRLHHARGGFARASDHSPKFAMAGSDPFYNKLFYDTNPFQPPAPIGQKEPDTEWGYWGKFFGAFGDREAVKGFTGYAHSTTGWATGADYQISDHTMVGVTLGMAKSRVDYAGSRDSSKIDAQYLGIYTGHNKEFWYVDSVLTLSRLGYTTERIVDLTSEQLAGEFNGFEINGYLEGGWDWGEAQGWLVQPMASVQLSFVQLESYTETGGASALSFSKQDMLSLKGSAGVRLTKDLVWTEKYTGKLQVRGRWVHEFGDNGSHVDAHFASNPGATFTVTDEGVAADSVVLGAGIHTDIGSGDTILLDYDIRVAADESAHVISGQWKHRW
ncbi:MAG: autotransporter domain-containing protein, partial [Planctomycetes bacterium]|nr:autotransporter domain-containing protein [Planctomycetota bacterium]